jgi:ribonucleoside-triphosphate reductase
LSNRIIQQTLEGLSVSAMPRVRTTDGHLLDWDRDAIAKHHERDQAFRAIL